MRMLQRALAYVALALADAAIITWEPSTGSWWDQQKRIAETFDMDTEGIVGILGDERQDLYLATKFSELVPLQNPALKQVFAPVLGNLKYSEQILEYLLFFQEYLLLDKSICSSICSFECAARAARSHPCDADSAHSARSVQRSTERGRTPSAPAAPPAGRAWLA